MPKTKPIFSTQIAGALCDMGFRVYFSEPNRNKPWHKVYHFISTPELLEAFDKILTARGEQKKK